jgi:hypothetical protein
MGAELLFWLAVTVLWAGLLVAVMTLAIDRKGTVEGARSPEDERLRLFIERVRAAYTNEEPSFLLRWLFQSVRNDMPVPAVIGGAASVEEVEAFLRWLAADIEARERRGVAALAYLGLSAVLLVASFLAGLFGLFLLGSSPWYLPFCQYAGAFLTANVVGATVVLVVFTPPSLSYGRRPPQLYGDIYMAQRMLAALEPDERDVLLARIRAARYPRLPASLGGMARNPDGSLSAAEDVFIGRYR